MSILKAVHERCRNRGWTSATPSLPPAGALALGASDDVRTPFAAAAAIASYLGVYLLGLGNTATSGNTNPNSSAAGLPVPPPMDLVSPGRLAALLRLLQYRPGGPAPMLEATEGAPCRCVVCVFVFVCVCLCVCLCVCVCTCV